MASCQNFDIAAKPVRGIVFQLNKFSLEANQSKGTKSISFALIFPSAVDAAWASWGYWSSCSKTCDGGVRSPYLRTHIVVQRDETSVTGDRCLDF